MNSMSVAKVCCIVFLLLSLRLPAEERNEAEALAQRFVARMKANYPVAGEFEIDGTIDRDMYEKLNQQFEKLNGNIPKGRRESRWKKTTNTCFAVGPSTAIGKCLKRSHKAGTSSKRFSWTAKHWSRGSRATAIISTSTNQLVNGDLRASIFS